MKISYILPNGRTPEIEVESGTLTDEEKNALRGELDAKYAEWCSKFPKINDSLGEEQHEFSIPSLAGKRFYVYLIQNKDNPRGPSLVFSTNKIDLKQDHPGAEPAAAKQEPTPPPSLERLRQQVEGKKPKFHVSQVVAVGIGAVGSDIPSDWRDRVEAATEQALKAPSLHDYVDQAMVATVMKQEEGRSKTASSPADRQLHGHVATLLKQSLSGIGRLTPLIDR